MSPLVAGGRSTVTQLTQGAATTLKPDSIFAWSCDPHQDLPQRPLRLATQAKQQVGQAGSSSQHSRWRNGLRASLGHNSQCLPEHPQLRAHLRKCFHFKGVHILPARNRLPHQNHDTQKPQVQGDKGHTTSLQIQQTSPAQPFPIQRVWRTVPAPEVLKKSLVWLVWLNG